MTQRQQSTNRILARACNCARYGTRHHTNTCCEGFRATHGAPTTLDHRIHRDTTRTMSTTACAIACASNDIILVCCESLALAFKRTCAAFIAKVPALCD